MTDWGKKRICSICEVYHAPLNDGFGCIGNGYNNMEEWKVRLRQMVLEPKPLQYIRGFL